MFRPGKVELRLLLKDFNLPPSAQSGRRETGAFGFGNHAVIARSSEVDESDEAIPWSKAWLSR